MSEALDLRTWSIEELAMLEQALSRQPHAERRFAETLGYISLAILLKPVEGECLDLYESHRAYLCPPTIPTQRGAEVPLEAA